MFDIGWPELLIILLLIFLLFGSRRLVDVSRELGRTVRDFRKELDASDGTTIFTENPLKVFISSVIDEFASERRMIADAIRQLPYVRPWLFEQTPPSSDPVEEFYLAQVRSCDIFILLVGHSISDPVAKEYETAISAHKPRVVLVDSTSKDERTQEFLNALDVKWSKFGDTEELQLLVQRAIINELINGYRRYRLSTEQVSALTVYLNLLDRGMQSKRNLLEAEQANPVDQQAIQSARQDFEQMMDQIAHQNTRLHELLMPLASLAVDRNTTRSDDIVTRSETPEQTKVMFCPNERARRTFIYDGAATHESYRLLILRYTDAEGVFWRCSRCNILLVEGIRCSQCRHSPIMLKHSLARGWNVICPKCHHSERTRYIKS